MTTKHEATPVTDHHAVITQLAYELKGASPSGVETIVDKMLVHLEAVKDPKAFEAKAAADKKAEDDREAIRAKERAELKIGPSAKPAKVA